MKIFLKVFLSGMGLMLLIVLALWGYDKWTWRTESYSIYVKYDKNISITICSFYINNHLQEIL